MNLITYDENTISTTKTMTYLTMTDLTITANVIYALITILLISYYKDISFAFTMVIIEIGYMIEIFSYSNKEDLIFGEKVTSIVVISIICLSIITSVVKYGKSVLGYELDYDVEKLIEKFNQNSEEQIKAEI